MIGGTTLSLPHALRPRRQRRPVFRLTPTRRQASLLGSGGGLSGGAVVPDGGGEREDALGDAGGDAVDGAAAVEFEVELAL